MALAKRVAPSDATVLIRGTTLWFAVGLADYLCHRATHISATSGAKESLIHLRGTASCVTRSAAVTIEFDYSTGVHAPLCGDGGSRNQENCSGTGS